ncbi:EboA domain-containing protein [Zeaxanthinibacter sp. PT1]|uniref:EboA domain-containing protein n=1 Tax=Zeaxanthinibacter TaxID=561554 RepID=UPI0023493490|nr:EboA domain-containing protein [Zeaxanthinibacter sp. PT1]MDC6352051.1 EboA domain-containing protein [Zeaxanthinibacter sp. PT1]
MYSENTGPVLAKILSLNLDQDTSEWWQKQLQQLKESPSARQLYLTYSLLGSKLAGDNPEYPGKSSPETEYLKLQGANTMQVARIYLLVYALETDREFYLPKVQKLIELADTGEMATFLKFLVLLPGAEDFKFSAVEALRTNIATVFDAIALDNPYPALFFNDQQWNQMYLKAAFMQRDLGKIQSVKERGNKDLSRIISDYAHERWAASREVDPQFWQPVGPFLEGTLIEDVKRLLNSDHKAEQRAGALLVSESGKAELRDLLSAHPQLQKMVGNKEIHWNNLNQ